MKIITRSFIDKIWRCRWILLIVACAFLVSRDMNCYKKVHAGNIYVAPIVEVCMPHESKATIIYHIDRSLESIYINYNLSKEIRIALDNARKRGIKIRTISMPNTIILDDHIVIMFGGIKMFIFDSISLAEECIND